MAQRSKPTAKCVRKLLGWHKDDPGLSVIPGPTQLFVYSPKYGEVVSLEAVSDALELGVLP